MLNAHDVSEELIAPHPLPLVIRPRGPANMDDLAHLLASDLPRLHGLQLRHGALLFRGFGRLEANDLARLTEAAQETSMRYLGGNSPRKHVANSVYTSTELPPDVRIPLHNELAYLSTYPRHIWFACVTAPAEGGETVLADARRVFRAIDRDLRRELIRRGVRYRCSFHGPSRFFRLLERVQKVTKSWMETFETPDPRFAERRCREVGADVRWLPSRRMIMEIQRPAAILHPETKEPVWFNFAHLFRLNPTYLGWLRYVQARLFFLRPETRTQHAQFGDGAEIPLRAIRRLLRAIDSQAVAIPWEAGDVLWLDNVLCMHGRNPFVGTRRILAAMTH